VLYLEQNDQQIH